MLSLLADENIKEQIVTGLRRRLRTLDILTVREAGLAGTPDPEVLEWAALDGRVLPVPGLEVLSSVGEPRLPPS